MDIYSSNFINNGFKSLMVCSNLSEDDLRAIGITLRGHIKDILLHSQDLRNSNNLIPACFGSHYNKNLPKLSIETSQALTTLPQTSEHSPRDPSLRGGRRQLTESYHVRAKWSAIEPRPHANFEYLLVRHGESEANVNATLYSTVADHAVKLSKKGEEQAKDAGRQIKSFYEEHYGKVEKNWRCRIWTSTYKRARQTANIIKHEAGEWITDIKESIFLVEQQFGLFEGVDWANGSVDDLFPQELAHYNKCATFGGRFWARVPMGESRFDVCRRVYHSLQPIREDGIEHVIIVSHGVTLRAVVMCLFNKTPEWFEEEPNPTNCSIKFISDKEEKYIWPKEEERKKLLQPDADLLLLKEEISNLRKKVESLFPTKVDSLVVSSKIEKKKKTVEPEKKLEDDEMNN
jgi:broad specificity phosphatase PhoE